MAAFVRLMPSDGPRHRTSAMRRVEVPCEMREGVAGVSGVMGANSSGFG